MNFTPGFILVLHTFGRDLKWNPHIHCLISEGGYSDNGFWSNINYFNYTFLRNAFRTAPSHAKNITFPEVLTNGALPSFPLSVMTRSNALNAEQYTTKALLNNLVYEERERELMFEGKRWFDLVRRSEREGNTSYLRQQVYAKGSQNASVVQSFLAQMDAIYWPYHIDEMKANTNLVQNPAFGSGENGSYETAK